VSGMTGQRSFGGQPENGRTGTARAVPGRPETRQTLRRHVGPKGELRPGGEKLLAVKGRASAG